MISATLVSLPSVHITQTTLLIPHQIAGIKSAHQTLYSTFAPLSKVPPQLPEGSFQFWDLGIFQNRREAAISKLQTDIDLQGCWLLGCEQIVGLVGFCFAGSQGRGDILKCFT